MSKKKKESRAEKAMDACDVVSLSEEGVESAEVECADASGVTSKSSDDQLSEALAEVADLKDKMLRLAADYENYKKRNERERVATMKYAGENIFREFLPVVDNLERAVSQGVVEGVEPQNNLTALLEGVELTLKSLYTSLEKFEVKAINSVGGPFDPNKQEALTMEASDSVPANHVVSEFEKGYFYKDRLLRAAKVIVSSGKAES